MPTYTVTIKIKCGERTCASKPGVFCEHLGSVRMGATPVCMLFPSEDGGSHTFLKETDDGWVARCDACLKQAV